MMQKIKQFDIDMLTERLDHNICLICTWLEPCVNIMTPVHHA